MQARAVAAFLGLACASALVGCGPPAKAPIDARVKSPYVGYTSKGYADPDRWLCLPGRADDACAGDLTATEIRADGSRVAEPASKPSSTPSKVDCFYVYPTVDLSLLSGNHDDFSDTRAMAAVAKAQAARFRDVCNVYAPLYRQITIGTYLRAKGQHESYASVAESDVVDAFLHYMGHWNNGKKVVLIGHSQGADMVKRLLARVFDEDPVMRERLLYAMPIGYRVSVPPNAVAGGSFKNIPLCETAEQTGCVIAFRSFVDAADAGPSRFDRSDNGRSDACVSPATLLHNESDRASGAYFPLGPRVKAALGGAFDDIDTPFVLLRDYYVTRCKTDASGMRYLAVTARPAEGDARKDGLNLGAWYWHGFMGLHLLDMQFPQGDLVELVGRQAAKIP